MIALDRDLFCAFQLERLWETPFPRCILCFSRSHRDWQRNHMNQNLSASFVWSNPNGIHKLCMSVLWTSQNTRQPAILNWDCIGREWSAKLRLWNPSSARLDGYIIVRVRYRRIHIWSIWCVICLGPPSAGRGWRAEDGGGSQRWSFSQVHFWWMICAMAHFDWLNYYHCSTVCQSEVHTLNQSHQVVEYSWSKHSQHRHPGNQCRQRQKSCPRRRPWWSGQFVGLKTLIWFPCPPGQS